MTTLLDHALAYARRGWPVFPVRKNKRPYTQHGFKDATLDEAQIQAWWRTWPTAGIGVATGSAPKLWVLDIDTAKGGQVSLDALELQHGPLETLSCRTGGGGRHLYYRWPADRVVRNRTDIEPGIDARGEGGYVVAPPSGHESGNTYAWELDAEIADAPTWLLDLVAPIERPAAAPPSAAPEPIRNPLAYGRGALRRATETVRGAASGTRNATLNTETFALVRLVALGALTRAEVESAMQLAGEAAGLTSSETRATIASALGTVREPVDAPPAAAPEPAADAAPLVLPSADPSVLAEAFLRTQRDEHGRALLRRWRGAWWRYEQGAYRELDDEEAEAPIWRWLASAWVRGSEAPKRVGTSISKVSNVARALTSIGTYVDTTVTPPLWIDGEHDLSPRDVCVCPNGLLELSTGTLHAHTPDLFAIARIGVPYDPAAPRPRRWLAFLEELFGDDHEAIDLLGEWFGYCLTTDTSLQKMLFVLGPRRSGKGTIARVLADLVGRGNVAGPTLSGLGTPFGLWPLLTRPLAIVPDARLRRQADEGAILERLLSITGEDALTVDRKNREPVTAKIPARLVVLSNELPRLPDASNALASRMLILRLRTSFLGREDPELTDRLLDELPGVLAWAVDGWRRLRERGRFAAPESGREDAEEFERLSSPVQQFVEEACIIDPEEWIERGALYERWASWAKEQGIDPGSAPMLGRNLRACVPSIVTSRPGERKNPERKVYYSGITIRSG